MKVLTVIKKEKKGNYTYELMAADGEPRYLHVNNHDTNNNSAMLPLEFLRKFTKEK